VSFRLSNSSLIEDVAHISLDREHHCWFPAVELID
jgi:hypothetical protein